MVSRAVVLVLALGVSGCVYETTAKEAISDPSLPDPEFCYGPAWPCGARGRPYMAAGVHFYAWPAGEPEKFQLVWSVDPPPDYDRSRAYHFRYGEAPPGWHEAAPAKPLESGMVYEFGSVVFVVEEDRIRRVRGRGY